MKKLIFGFGLILVSGLGFNSPVSAQLAVDGLNGVETQAAAQANPELASQFGIGSTAACTGGGGTTNCGASQQNVADFQAAVNGGGGSPSTAGSAGYYQVKLQEPLSGQSAYVSASNGVDLINQYISMIYMWMASIVGIIAVLMIVVSGIQIIFGGASPELVSDAKNRVTQALLSLVLLFATAMILRTVNPNFFGFM